MTRQRLDDQRLTNLSDTLDATPGIIVLRDGQGAESDGYFSRGFEIQNFEIDGVPTVKRMDNYTQSMAMYDRVEVVRGATGLISGLGSPSATINLIRKRPTAEAQASISAEAGTWDRYGTGFDVSGPLTETGNVRGRLVADFKTEQSWIDRYKQDSQLIYGITEFDLTEDTLLTMGFSYQRTNVDSPMRSGLPTRFTDGSRANLKRSLNSAQSWSYNDHEQTSFFTSIEQQFASGWSGKVELTHTENKFDEVSTTSTAASTRTAVAPLSCPCVSLASRDRTTSMPT
jgi:outer membrane receptor for ferric coprogen and ferric-rhodotorulic acid